jgi:hypothetical protein
VLIFTEFASSKVFPDIRRERWISGGMHYEDSLAIRVRWLLVMLLSDLAVSVFGCSQLQFLLDLLQFNLYILKLKIVSIIIKATKL